MSAGRGPRGHKGAARSAALRRCALDESRAHLVLVVLDLLDERVDRLLPARVGRALVLERVSLVNKKDSAEGALDRIACKLRRLAVVRADEVLARDLDELAGLEDTERAHHARDQLGHLRLARPRVAKEKHVKHSLLANAKVCAPALHFDRVAQRDEHLLDLGEADERGDLLLEVGDRLGGRQLDARVRLGVRVATRAAAPATRLRPHRRPAAVARRATRRGRRRAHDRRVGGVDDLGVLERDVQAVAGRAAEVPLALEFAVAVRRRSLGVQPEANDSVPTRKVGGADVHGDP